ncbi:MAG: hypothetical protein NZ572_08100 [Thermoflexus sp.]|nr:hypothetical protein [Thermoflexus sp.]
MPNKARIRVSVVLSSNDPLREILAALPPPARGRAVRLFLLRRMEEFRAHVQAMTSSASGPEAAPESPRPSQPKPASVPSRTPPSPRYTREKEGEDEARRLLLEELERWDR